MTVLLSLIALIAGTGGQAPVKAPAWTAQVKAEGSFPKVVFSNGYFFMGSIDTARHEGRVFAFRTDTGKPAWDQTVRGIGDFETGRTFDLIPTARGVAYLSMSHLIELSQVDGSVRCQTEVHGKIEAEVSATADGFVLASDDQNATTLHFYSSEAKTVTDHLPASFFPPTGSRAVSFGTSVFLATSGGAVKKAVLQEAGLGPPSKVWVLPGAFLLTRTEYGMPQQEWPYDPPPPPASFSQMTNAVSLYAPAIERPFDYARAWTSQTVYRKEVAPIFGFYDVVVAGESMWARYFREYQHQGRWTREDGYAQFDAQPRILATYPNRLLMFVDRGGRLVSADLKAQTVHGTAAVVSIAGQPSSKATHFRIEIPSGEPWQKQSLFGCSAGLVVVTYTRSPGDTSYTVRYFPTKT